MVSVMTTVTQQSMMLDWVNVGTDSDHWTVKVNVNVTVDNYSALTLNSHQSPALLSFKYCTLCVTIIL